MQGAEPDQAQCLTNFHNHIIKHQWYFSAFVGGNPRKRIQLGQPKRRTNVRADFGLHWFYQKLFPSKIWSSLETWSSTEWCKLKIVMFMYCSQDIHDILTAENTTRFFFFKASWFETRTHGWDTEHVSNELLSHHVAVFSQFDFKPACFYQQSVTPKKAQFAEKAKFLLSSPFCFKKIIIPNILTWVEQGEKSRRNRENLLGQRNK